MKRDTGEHAQNPCSTRASEVSVESRSSLLRLWQRKSIELVEQMQQSDL